MGPLLWRSALASLLFTGCFGTAPSTGRKIVVIPVGAFQNDPSVHLPSTSAKTITFEGAVLEAVHQTGEALQARANSEGAPDCAQIDYAIMEGESVLSGQKIPTYDVTATLNYTRCSEGMPGVPTESIHFKLSRDGQLVKSWKTTTAR